MARIGIDVRLWNETGVGRYIRNLVIRLGEYDKKNTYVLFALPKDVDEIRSHIPVHGLHYEVIEANVRWHTVKEQMMFPRILNKASLDLVHFPYFSVPIFYNSPYVVTVHDLILHHYPTGKASTRTPLVYFLKYKGYEMVFSETVKKAKKIITVSQATKKELLSHFHVAEEKVEITYEGIDKEVVGEKNLHFHQTTPYFLYVGNAYPHKNLERLIAAFEKLHETNSDPVRLVFVGKEDYFYAKLKKIVVEKKLSSSIVFYENVSDANLSLLYQHAIALVLPSLMEGFGLPALEAMANDCLVVASNIPALQEICGSAAAYINPFDTEDIFRVMEGIMYAHPSYLDAKRELGKKRAKSFSWKEMVKKTLQVYESCISL